MFNGPSLLCVLKRLADGSLPWGFRPCQRSLCVSWLQTNWPLHYCLLPLLGFVLLLALILSLIVFTELHIFLRCLPCSSAESVCVTANTVCCFRGLVLGFMSLCPVHSNSGNRIFFFKLNCCLEGRVALESGSQVAPPSQHPSFSCDLSDWTCLHLCICAFPPNTYFSYLSLCLMPSLSSLDSSFASFFPVLCFP